MRAAPSPRRQGGFVLIISLIMLVVLTLLAISSINLSTANLRIVNSMQARSECMAASQQTVDQMLSSYFIDNISTLRGQTYNVTVSGNTCPVRISTICLKTFEPIRNTALNLADPNDVKCFDTTTNPFSACSTTVWEIETNVAQGLFGANVTLRQGISVRMDTSSVYGYRATGTVSAPTPPHTTGYICNPT